jgi:hypothetical protein
MDKEDEEYIEALEGIAKEMTASIENMLSIIDPKRERLCGDFGAMNQAAFILDEYYKLQHGSSGE